MRRLVALIAIALLALPQLGEAKPAKAKTVKCAGKKATIVGTSGPDVLEGTPKDDIIAGLGGADDLVGEGGNDIICAGPGSEYLNGGPGNDRLYGQGGDDYMEGKAGNDTIDGGPGRDSAAWQDPPGPITASLATGKATGEGTDILIAVKALEGSPFDDQLTGSDRTDELYGRDGNDTIAAGGGDDYFEGGPGDDTINGEAGEFDFASFSEATGPMSIDVGAGTATGQGNDTLMGAEIVSGSGFNDSLIGSERREILWPLGGDDTLDGRGDFDAVAYESAPGPITASLATGKESGEGNDTFTGFEAIFGGPHNDVLEGSDNAPFEDLVGHGGNDTLRGGGGEDYIEGNAGDDTIDGGVGPYDAIGHGDSLTAVTIDLAAGTVTGEGNDSITEIEIAIGSRHNDTLLGDANATLFYGLEGDDHIDGRAGHDIVLYESATRGVNANLASGTASGEGNDTLAGIEGLLGSLFDDTLTGDGGNNVLVGYLGNDTLVGGDGADYFEPGPGNDVVDGQAGGQDIVDYYYAPMGVSVDLGSGTATGQGDDVLTAIEEVLGSLFDDVLFGNQVGNYLYGDLGNDIIEGRDGDDGLDGFDGNDTLNGGAGSDECFGAETTSACELTGEPQGNSLKDSGRDTSDYAKRNNM